MLTAIALQSAAVVVLGLLAYEYIIYPGFISPLSKIPNAHFSSPYSSSWIWWRRRSRRQLRTLLAAHRRHGPLVRLGPKELSVASLDGLRQVYTGGFDKDRWYLDEFQNYGTPNLVSLLEREPHSAQKRMITNVYSKSYLQSSSDLKVLSEVLLFDRMLPVLESAVENGRPMDVYSFARAAGMDFMTAYLFGLDNSSDFMLDSETRDEYFSNYLIRERHLSGVEKATQAVESLVLSMCRAAEDWSVTHSERKSQTVQQTNPVVYRQLSSHLSATSLPANQTAMFRAASEMFDHTLAGHEAVGIILTYVFHELSRRPGLQTSLREELLTLSPLLQYEPREEKSQSPHLPSSRDVDSLPLLNAVVLETLRLYAPAPGPQPRITPPGGATIDGYSGIPAGVKVSTSSYCLHRNEDIFPDSTAFKPERWMQGENDLGGSKEMKRWFWAFGSGGRMCIGNHFAMIGTRSSFSIAVDFGSLTSPSDEVDRRIGLHQLYDKHCR